MATAFDTLKLARALRDDAHITPEPAEGMAGAIVEAMAADLVTKADLFSGLASAKGNL
jgi:hypothetical protein